MKTKGFLAKFIYFFQKRKWIISLLRKSKSKAESLKVNIFTLKHNYLANSTQNFQTIICDILAKSAEQAMGAKVSPESNINTYHFPLSLNTIG